MLTLNMDAFELFDVWFLKISYSEQKNWYKM